MTRDRFALYAALIVFGTPVLVLAIAFWLAIIIWMF